MLSDEKITYIRNIAQEFWESEVKEEYFINLAKGKEIGHRLADLVHEKTCALITLKNHLTKHEHDSRGRSKARSMGDIWLEENGIYHPINVKTGVAGSEGQPNMVSLKKVLDTLVNGQIDSYYLLMVKLDIGPVIIPTIYFVDMLDFLNFVTFDSGPGQIMLKAKTFFNNYNPNSPIPRHSTREKVISLMNLLEDGERRLKINRERDLAEYRARVAVYLSSDELTVTPEAQRGLNLQ